MAVLQQFKDVIKDARIDFEIKANYMFYSVSFTSNTCRILRINSADSDKFSVC